MGVNLAMEPSVISCVILKTLLRLAPLQYFPQKVRSNEHGLFIAPNYIKKAPNSFQAMTTDNKNLNKERKK